MKLTHIAFSDETKPHKDRYRAIGIISFAKESENFLRNSIEKILDESKTSDFKWQKVRNAKYRLAAKK